MVAGRIDDVDADGLNDHQLNLKYEVGIGGFILDKSFLYLL
jgi:hypothetical protein